MAGKMIAYYRVSTDRAVRSQPRLADQKAAVEAYAKSRGAVLIGRYMDIETGRREARRDRPQLREAIERAQVTKGTLVIATFVDLVKSVTVTSLLRDSGVEFACCDSAVVNRSTIGLIATLAEDESRRISQRTKAALAAYKRSGGRLGSSLPQCRNLTDKARRKGARAASEKRRRAAVEFYLFLGNFVGAQRAQGKSLQAIADMLNARGQATRWGKAWSAMQVKRVLDRIEQLE